MTVIAPQIRVLMTAQGVSPTDFLLFRVLGVSLGVSGGVVRTLFLLVRGGYWSPHSYFFFHNDVFTPDLYNLSFRTTCFHYFLVHQHPVHTYNHQITQRIAV